jgi:hypothetical protein
VLRKSEHGSPTDPSEAPGGEAVNVQFLIAFVRNMIRNNPSSDLWQLSMYAAMKEVPITDEQKAAFEKAVLNEVKQAPWPDGFF